MTHRIGFPTILAVVAACNTGPAAEPPVECAGAWGSEESRALVDALLQATGSDRPVWGSYDLGDGAYVLHAGASETGEACLGLFRDGRAVAYASAPEEPALLTPLYGYYFHAEWQGRAEAPMLERARQPPSIQTWLEELGVESAVLLPVTVPDFPIEMPAIVKAQLAVHEGFHVEVQAPRWWARAGEWPIWDFQPDRAGVTACYTASEEVATILEEEREALVGLVTRLLDGSVAGACDAGAEFLSLRSERYGLLDEVRVGRDEGPAAGCEEAETLMELEEGTADYASWTVLFDLGQVERDQLVRRYRARQDDVFYLTGAMQLHAIQLMSTGGMPAVTRRINASAGPEDGSITSVLSRTLDSYCRRG